MAVTVTATQECACCGGTQTLGSERGGQFDDAVELLRAQFDKQKQQHFVGMYLRTSFDPDTGARPPWAGKVAEDLCSDCAVALQAKVAELIGPAFERAAEMVEAARCARKGCQDEAHDHGKQLRAIEPHDEEDEDGAPWDS